MVARIIPIKGITDSLNYNEEKVAKGAAIRIHAENFLQTPHKIAYPDTLDRFERLNALNTRAKQKMWHASLNFHPTETLSDDTLTAIANRYMQGLGMEDQPYVVYRHTDANHPHLHIVSSLVRPDGSRIETHHMANHLSEPTRKAIEKEFQLLPGQGMTRTKIPAPDEMRTVRPDAGIPITEAMNNTIAGIHHHYHFTKFSEYNAILRAFNLTAETGSQGSKTQRHNGIFYLVLDDHGRRISPPVMASQLPFRPTQTRLKEKYRTSATQQTANLPSIKSRIDHALDQQPPTLRALAAQLRSHSIEIIRPPANGRNPHDQIFIDHRTRTAITGEALGATYTTPSFSSLFPAKQRASKQQQKRLKPKPDEDLRFNANVPQVLSALLHAETVDPISIQHSKSQRQNRHK